MWIACEVLISAPEILRHQQQKFFCWRQLSWNHGMSLCLLVCRTSFFKLPLQSDNWQIHCWSNLVTCLVIIGYCCNVPAVCSCEITCQSNSKDSIAVQYWCLSRGRCFFVPHCYNFAAEANDLLLIWFITNKPVLLLLETWKCISLCEAGDFSKERSMLWERLLTLTVACTVLRGPNLMCQMVCWNSTAN